MAWCHTPWASLGLGVYTWLLGAGLRLQSSVLRLTPSYESFLRQLTVPVHFGSLARKKSPQPRGRDGWCFIGKTWESSQRLFFSQISPICHTNREPFLCVRQMPFLKKAYHWHRKIGSLIFKILYELATLDPFFFITKWAPLSEGNGAHGSGTRIRHRIQGGRPGSR